MHGLTVSAAVLGLCLGQLASPGFAQDADLDRLVEQAREGLEVVEPVQAPPEEADPENEVPYYFTGEELESLVAPFALYPDALLAQVLVASTFPLQIVYADRLLARMDALTDAEIQGEVESHEWDPSVLVLFSGFPTVVQRMAEDLEETEDLGLAMAQQDQEVLEAVQRLREQAEATGYLQSNEAQLVGHEEDGITIEPADPEVIYVPQYDPVDAYSFAPTAPPVITAPSTPSPLANPLISGAIGFGSALLVDQLFGSGDDDDDEGWDDYWRQGRPIDWSNREIYARPYRSWDDGERRRAVSWSHERDRYWDRQARRWQRDAEQARTEAWREQRQARTWEVRRDAGGDLPRLRPNDWRGAVVQVPLRESEQARRERREEAARQARREREASLERRDAAQEREAERNRAAERQRAAAEARRREADRDAERRREAEAQRERQQGARQAAERRQEAERQREARDREAEARRQRDAAQREREPEAARADARRREEAERQAREQQADQRQRREAEARREREAEAARAEQRRREEADRQARQQQAAREAGQRQRREAEARREREAEAARAEERRRREAAEQQARQQQQAAREAEERRQRDAEARRQNEAARADEQRRREQAEGQAREQQERAAEQRQREAAAQRQREAEAQRDRNPQQQRCRNLEGRQRQECLNRR
jgi:Protein of unknown function (DUF3300)